MQNVKTSTTHKLVKCLNRQMWICDNLIIFDFIQSIGLHVFDMVKLTSCMKLTTASIKIKRRDYNRISCLTVRWVQVDKVRFGSEHDFLQDDSEAVDVSFLSSVDRSSCHTQQLRCCPQLIAVKLKVVHLYRLFYAMCFSLV